MAITEYDVERNQALDALIKQREEYWKPHKENIIGLKTKIGLLLAERDFLEKFDKEKNSERISQLNTDISLAIKAHQDYIEKTNELCTSLQKQIDILNELKN